MDETLNQKLDRAHDWFNRNMMPVVDKLHAFDSDGALAQLEGVKAELESSGLEEELITYLHVRLRYVEWQATKLGREPDAITDLQADLLDYLAEEDSCSLALAVRRAYLIMQRTQLLRDEGIDYPATEFKAHLQVVPRELYTNEFDLYVAVWGYLNADLPVLERVFGDLTINPGQYQISFVWQSINLMFQLVNGKATSRDVLEMVKVINHIRHWQFLDKLCWQDCVDRGLVDEPVEKLLMDKLAELNVDTRDFIQNEQRTKRVRKDH